MAFRVVDRWRGRRRGIAGALLWLVALLASGAVAEPHTFRFDPPGDARSVHVAGTFNGWSRDAHALSDADGDGVYEATLDLPEGVHHYKFVVNGDQWLNDPASDRELEQSDGHGGVNSAVLVGPDARKLPPAEPGRINPRGLLHDPADAAQFSVADGIVRFGLKVQANDADQVRVRWTRFDAQGAPLGDGVTEMHRVGSALGFDMYAAGVPITGDHVMYRFDVRDDMQWTHFGSQRSTPDPSNPYGLFEAKLAPSVGTPPWAYGAVWYQIFPERFRNGDPRNDPPGTQRWQSDWWAMLPGELSGAENFYGGHGNVWRRRFGGDLQGAMQALPYLKELGVNAIYFNPLFEAESAHKYEATDHRHIDDNFGVVEDHSDASVVETHDPATWRWTKSDLLFLDFLDAAHAQGFRVIIDGVWNHVGVSHWAFQDVLRHGKESKYADWFEIVDWGDPRNWGREPWHAVHGKEGGIQWNAWDRKNGDLPTFRKDPELGLAPGPREHVMAVTRRWMTPVVDGVARRGVDGWRLDVPHDIPMPFWRDWRELVKELNPEGLIIGEVWGPAEAWLNCGDVFDGVMNYQFAIAAEQFFVDRATAITPSEFGARLTHLFNAYPLASAFVQQNLLASHDTERLASMFLNPDRNYDQGSRLQDGAAYSAAKPQAAERARMMQAVACQFTFAGAPMVYYGDEAGMWGPDDPSNRMPMVWRDLLPYDDPEVTFDAELFAWHQRLAGLRVVREELRLGFFRVTQTDDSTGVLVYVREAGEKQAWVVLNRSDAPRTVRVAVGDGVADGTGFCDWLNESHAQLVLEPGQRPRLTPVDAPLRAAGGEVSIDLPAHGSAVITVMPFE